MKPQECLMKNRKAAMIFALVMFIAATLVVSPTMAASSCSCLNFFQYNKSLPPTGQSNFAAYRYGDWLSTYKGSYARNGYRVSYVTPSTSPIGQLLLAGTAVVFNPGTLGANSTYGHIGIVTRASYDTRTKKWTIQFKDANSSYPFAPGTSRLSTESNCSNVGYRQIVTTSLSGLRFFNWSKK
jgi:hypothetical protein